MLTTAPMLITNAAIARPLSSPLTVGATGPAGAFGRGGVGAGAVPVAGRGAGAAGAVPGRVVVAGAAGAGRAPVGGGTVGAGRGGAGAAGADAPAAGAGAAVAPLGGKVGKRMVAVGLGGRLIRTVSFLG